MNRDTVVHQIPGTRVLVDAFRGYHQPARGPRSEALFFLSHFHGDHYEGLTEGWTTGVIHCSEITARLLVRVLGVDPKFVKALPFDQEVAIGGAEDGGLTVCLCDANHCPGAALLLFGVPTTTDDPPAAGGGGGGSSRGGGKKKLWYLHTGDMRYDPRMQSYPAFAGPSPPRIDTVYLDTTYAHPKHNFTAQTDAIAVIADTIRARLSAEEGEEEEEGKAEAAASASSSSSSAAATTPASTASSKNGRTLFLLSAYKLGKERLLMGVARAVGRPVVVDQDKRRVLECLGIGEDEMARCFTTDPRASPLRVVRMGTLGEMWPFFRPNFGEPARLLEEERAQGRGYTRVLGFIPTGWSSSSPYNKRNALKEQGAVSIQLVPYSEHSNFSELMEFVRFLKPRCVLPTVYADDKDRQRVAARFRALVDHTANKQAFFAKFQPQPPQQQQQLQPPRPSSGAEAAAAAAVAGEEEGDEAAAAAEEEEGIICIDDNDDDDDDEKPSPLSSLSVGAWQCGACTYLNSSSSSGGGGEKGCAMCGTPRGYTEAPAAAAAAAAVVVVEGEEEEEQQQQQPATKKQRTLLSFLQPPPGKGDGGGGKAK